MKINVDKINSITPIVGYYPVLELDLDCDLDDILLQFDENKILSYIEKDTILDSITPNMYLNHYGLDSILDNVNKEDIEKYLKERE